MRNSLLTIFSYMASGIFALLIAVYLASAFVRPGASMTNLAQNETPAVALDTDTEAPSAAKKVTGVSRVEPTTNVAEAFLEPFIYDTREGRRNPFRAFSMLDASAYSNVVIGPSTPLERYELDELKLTGILWDVKNPKAMFIDPQKEVHILSKDDRIGRRRGYVAVIREGEVVVVETTTFSGEPVYSTRVLKIER